MRRNVIVQTVSSLALMAAAAIVVVLALGSNPARSSARHHRHHHRAVVARRLGSAVAYAKARYRDETTGPKVHSDLNRVARDGALLTALSRGNLSAARAAASRQLAHGNAHVTRIAVFRGSRMLVNAVINADGAFVVAPAKRALRLHGRTVGTLWVSIQDVIGFVRLVHRQTGTQVVARGSSGQVRASLGAAANARLPRSGHVTIGRHRYAVSSFGETGWGGESLTIWILG